MAWEFGQVIWDGLKAEFNNEIGVAGLMGNLVAESALIPYRIEGDFSTGYINSINYTNQVDSGAISESAFVNSYTGYGLAQWTYYNRKQALYDMKLSMGVSIGDVHLAIAYLIHELTNSYHSVYDEILNGTTIRQVSDTVLFDFENPADQSEPVQIYRASLGQAVYDEYHGTTPPEPPVKSYKMPLWMMCIRR
jgi:hypothetical protein